MFFFFFIFFKIWYGVFCVHAISIVYCCVAIFLCILHSQKKHKKFVIFIYFLLISIIFCFWGVLFGSTATHCLGKFWPIRSTSINTTLSYYDNYLLLKQDSHNNLCHSILTLSMNMQWTLNQLHGSIINMY